MHFAKIYRKTKNLESITFLSAGFYNLTMSRDIKTKLVLIFRLQTKNIRRDRNDNQGYQDE